MGGGISGYGSGRTPGPLGSSTRVGGRIPGPLRRRPLRVADVSSSSKIIEEMPNPGPDSGAVRAHAVEWKLFDGEVTPLQVRQGRLANCPLPSLLAALANTKVGRKRIHDILTAERSGTVETNLSGVVDKLEDDPDSPIPKRIISKRYFVVTLGKSFETSDVFYTDNVDRDWTPFYMQHYDLDPRIENSSDILWPAVIEKAYARQRQGYDKITESKSFTLNAVWKDIVGNDPGGFKLEDKTDKDILEVIKAAGTVPTVAASRHDKSIGKRSDKKLTDDHGYAVLGLQGSEIELYNPWGWRVRVSMKEFRTFFESILFGNP